MELSNKKRLVLTQDDVIGATIVGIFMQEELLDGWLDASSVYIQTDKGHIFGFPEPNYPWETERVPPQAEQLADEWEETHHQLDADPPIETKKKIKLGIIGRTITCVFCRLDEDGEPNLFDVIIGLDDGRWLKHEAVYPHGVGFAGLHILGDHKVNIAEYIDFWDIPVTKAWATED